MQFNYCCWVEAIVVKLCQQTCYGLIPPTVHQRLPWYKIYKWEYFASLNNEGKDRYQISCTPEIDIKERSAWYWEQEEICSIWHYGHLFNEVISCYFIERSGINTKRWLLQWKLKSRFLQFIFSNFICSWKDKCCVI